MAIVQHSLIEPLMAAELFPDIRNLEGFPVIFTCPIEDGLSMADKDKVVVVSKFISEVVVDSGVG